MIYLCYLHSDYFYHNILVYLNIGNEYVIPIRLCDDFRTFSNFDVQILLLRSYTYYYIVL